MKLERLIGILSILLQQEKVTAPYLAEKFEVSRRTIIRDVEALCMAGIPIATSQGTGGGISIMEGYRIDRTLLTSTDMQAILAGLRSLDSVSGTNRYAQLMEKLSVGSSSLMTGDQHILIDLSSWQKTSLPPKIERLHHAVETGRLVSFLYYSPSGETQRTIEPYDLLFHWSSWYVWGWCRTREDFRLFKLNRMTNVLTGEVFVKREAPLPDLSSEKVFAKQEQIKAVFDSDCKWRLIEEYGEEICTRPLPPHGRKSGQWICHAALYVILKNIRTAAWKMPKSISISGCYHICIDEFLICAINFRQILTDFRIAIFNRICYDETRQKLLPLASERMQRIKK